ncbi:Tetracycline repressor protein class E [Paraconexibacter sp. AEG42_29]|uniref:Tetracycline repressor protein class E n=1 Tax=Paraconexibacter sp. AEG42_29 TaxID=2997339 RepID=A0AAU7B161_9ACTN
MDLETLLEAALRIIDSDGVKALTMRRLASTAGVSTMAVYHHVANKDELLRLAAAHVMRGMPPPPADVGWVSVLRSFFTELHDRFLQHPGVVQLHGRDTFLSEAVYEICEPVFGAMLRAGFQPDDAMSMFMGCASLTVGHAQLESAGGEPDDAPVVLDRDRYPALAQVAKHLPSRAARERFLTSLDRQLAAYPASDSVSH